MTQQQQEVCRRCGRPLPTKAEPEDWDNCCFNPDSEDCQQIAEIAELKSACREMGKALKFYAEPNSWRPICDEWEGSGTYAPSDALQDTGTKARATLAAAPQFTEQLRADTVSVPRATLEMWSQLLDCINGDSEVRDEINALLQPAQEES